MLAVCGTCGKSKDVLDFIKHYSAGPYESWNLRRCKSCAHDKYIERYAKPASRKALHEASSNWKKANPESHAKLAREYRKKHPEKIIAQNRLNYAIRKGAIKRGICEVCGTDKKVHAHHISYEPKDWYNVKWLCYVCHKLEHYKGDLPHLT